MQNHIAKTLIHVQLTPVVKSAVLYRATDSSSSLQHAVKDSFSLTCVQVINFILAVDYVPNYLPEGLKWHSLPGDQVVGGGTLDPRNEAYIHVVVAHLLPWNKNQRDVGMACKKVHKQERISDYYGNCTKPHPPLHLYSFVERIIKTVEMDETLYIFTITFIIHCSYTFWHAISTFLFWFLFSCFWAVPWIA